MPNNYDTLSELERELELDMTNAGEFEVEASEEAEEPGEFESDEEFEEMDAGEFEMADSEADESEADEFEGDFADRLYEIAQREYDNPVESAEAIEGVVNEMYENFLGGRIGKFLKKKGLGLLKRGIKIASNHPLLKGVLAGKSLSGILSTVAQAAASSTPLGAAVMPFIKNLGFSGNGAPAEQKEAWNNFVEVAREAYADLGSNLSEAANHPLRAQQIAARSFARGVRQVVQRRRQGFGRVGGAPIGGRRVIRIHVKPGQRKSIRLEIIGQ